MIRQSHKYRYLDKEASYRHEEELATLDIPQWKKDVIYESTPASCTHLPALLHLANTVEYLVENDIPGDFVECGVYMGGSCMVIAGVLKHYASDRRILMYDTFDGVPMPNSKELTMEGESLQEWYKDNKIDSDGNSSWCYCNFEDVSDNMKTVGYDGDIKYIKGDVLDTIPNNHSTQIALLRIDVDLDLPTRHVLDHLYSLVPTNGSLILDDYGHFPKVKDTVDDFLQDDASKLEEITYTVRHIRK